MDKKQREWFLKDLLSAALYVHTEIAALSLILFVLAMAELIKGL